METIVAGCRLPSPKATVTFFPAGQNSADRLNSMSGEKPHEKNTVHYPRRPYSWHCFAGWTGQTCGNSAAGQDRTGHGAVKTCYRRERICDDERGQLALRDERSAETNRRRDECQGRCGIPGSRESWFR